jgi:phosphatidylserine/phosphatidylglycerophosphate/cardiolipin synthase-like enzyme
VHDVQAVVNGEAAQHLADLARERWRRATAETLHAPEVDEHRWIPGLDAEFENVDVGISRTAPPWQSEPSVTEIAELTIDAIRSARRSIYIEAQYFSCRKVGAALAERLAEPNGPEVVVIAACSSHGFIEHVVMSNNRDRMIRRLRRVDKYDRLRVFYPVVTDGNRTEEILIHAKLMIVDDKFVRIGSANLNNRSRGLDTECDISIEASTPATQSAIAALRARLLAEHLGVTPAMVERAVIAKGSLIGAIEHLNGRARQLHAFPAMSQPDGPTRPIFGTGLFDPPRPITLMKFFRRRKPRVLSLPAARAAARQGAAAMPLGTPAR